MLEIYFIVKFYVSNHTVTIYTANDAGSLVDRYSILDPMWYKEV